MTNFDQMLEKYADLAVRVGVNIQKGQNLNINAPISTVDYVRKVVKKAYEAGARNVYVEWNDDEVTRTRYDLAPDEAFTDYPMWKAKGMEELAEGGAAFLSIVSSNPDLLKGVDPERIAKANKSAGMAMDKFRSYSMSDKVSWSVIAVPSISWAEKVFPNLSSEEQVDKLWEAIFQATRVNTDDPVLAWKEHNATLHTKVDYLNGKKYKKLHYKAPGTDLVVELPEGHMWIGGGSVNEQNNPFVANMPTEEVFTLPLKEGVNGYVSSTKPLNYGGSLIENFTLTFEKGRIVRVKAESGEETLKRLVDTDEGSHYLGEVALVPHNSPISQSNIIFYNTLFDENASNHFALGNAYAFCIEGGKTMSKEELAEKGANSSITHVDFMVGSAEMDIDGITTDGKVEPVFRNGNWAF
ncbi:aminopeptidase [Fredinandcohnia quinoae]|uniref:Aminopeptidase n=1 Tax=Fredinandcohnia quinoae TaxID=2918902 RepID=A0AAW5E392_9BACI|nr:aminopeptidase [Fredinandcohnia sp. SECRCQ15]MCH1626978.1 aminopeptidase [Fredinandcohnia sp. SECRCQ15]